jgi:DNA transformation protein
LAITPEYREFLAELFAGAGRVTVRRLFNFNGLYKGEVMFGIVVEERVYLKTNEQSRKVFAGEGAKPWRYTARNGEKAVTSYWSIPERLYDEPGALAEWAERAYEIALASPTTVRKRARRMKTKSARKPARKRSRS